MSNAREIRPLQSGDHMRRRELMSQAFGKGKIVAPSDENSPPPDMSNMWGLFVGGDLQAALSIRPFQTHWGADTVLPLGGIAGVATWAQARGMGYAAKLLTEALRIMRDRGEVLSALYPFSYAFYRKFGWEWVGEKRLITLPLRELRSYPEGKFVRDITERDGASVRPRIEAAYTRFARNYRGVFTQDTHQWENTFANRGYTNYVYEYEPTGEYLLWCYNVGDNNGDVWRWITRTPEGFRAHLSLLHYLGAQCETAVIRLPGDSFLPAHLMHNDMETKVEPVFMGRVVDFAGAMQALPPVPDVPDASLTLAVHDEHAPWNAGVWNIGVEDGRIFCLKTNGDARTANVKMDIQALSQAFWGTPSLEWLRNAGRVAHVGDKAAWSLLCRLLPPHPVHTMDDF